MTNTTVMKKVDVNKAYELFQAYNGFDGETKIQNVNGQEQSFRVPFELGTAVRMAVVRNIIVLKTVCANADEVKKSLLKEIWPDAPDISNGIPLKDFPDGAFEKFKEASNEAAKHQEEIKLYLITTDQLKNVKGEIPLFALSTLLENDLLIDADDKPTSTPTKHKKPR